MEQSLIAGYVVKEFARHTEVDAAIFNSFADLSAERLGPAIVVVDQASIEVAERARSAFDGVRVVVVFTLRPAVAMRTVVRRVRPEGCLSTMDSMREFGVQVSRIVRGEMVVSSSLSAYLGFDARNKRFDPPENGVLEVLTPRQLRSLRLLAQGRSVKETARILETTPKAIDNQKTRMMRKLGVRDRVELARIAIREGLIEA